MRATSPFIALLLPMASLAAAPPAGSPAARDYMAAATQSDAFEQLTAELVLTGSREPRVRAFAHRMMADHERTTRSLAEAAGKAGLSPPPAAMGEDQAHLLAALQGLSGHDLDVAYARQQVLAHRSALTVEQGYAVHGDDPALRQAAAAAVPVITAHLSAAEQLRSALEGT